MLKELKNNENGVVFITVLMIIIVMMVLTVSILSMNVSQVTSSEEEIRRIHAEILALSKMRYGFAHYLNSNFVSSSENLTLENTTYTIDLNIDTSDPSIPAPLEVTVSY